MRRYGPLDWLGSGFWFFGSDISKAVEPDAQSFFFQVVNQHLGHDFNCVKFVVSELGVAILALNYFSPILSRLQVEAVLCEYVSAQVFWQLMRLVNLNNKVDSLVNQIRGLVWNEIELFTALGVHGYNVDVQLTMHFESGSNQVNL